jgi:hypothetical protein
MLSESLPGMGISSSNDMGIKKESLLEYAKTLKSALLTGL